VNIYYLLPCTCSRKIPVQPRQAGEIVTCACGATLEVPTLLRLKTLERAEIPAEPKKTKTPWTAGHRLIFIGALVIFLCVCIAAWLLFIRPTDPYANFTPEQMKLIAEKFTPVQNWNLWQNLQRSGLEHHKRYAEITFGEQLSQFKVYWALLALVAGIAAALIAAGIVLVSRSRAPRGNKVMAN
jgi:hypothetical protein